VNLFGILGRYVSIEPSDSEAQPAMVVQYGSTKSNTFRKEALRGNFGLPSEVADQAILDSTLRALRQFYLPEFTEDDSQSLREMLALLDECILRGLEDSSSWALPRGFSEIPFVKTRLGRGYPVAQILEYLLLACRMYMWLYRGEQDVKEFIPILLELEDSFEPLRIPKPSGAGRGIRGDVEL
jgi:hypothetical protein